MIRKGSPRYTNEVEELMHRLKAKGIVLIVVGGKRNVDHVEFTTALPADEVDFTMRSLAYTVSEMMNNFKEFDPQVRKL